MNPLGLLSVLAVALLAFTQVACSGGRSPYLRVENVNVEGRSVACVVVGGPGTALNGLAITCDWEGAR